MSISTSEILKNNKIGRARRASAISSLLKITSAYYTKLQGKSSYYLLIMYVKRKKKAQKVKTDEILKACACYL